MDKVEFWIRLLMVKGIRTKILQYLSRGTPFIITNVDSILYQLGFNTEQYKQFEQTNEQYLKASLDWLKSPENRLITYEHPDYPYLLRHINTPPLALFVSCQLHNLSSIQLSMVGSRHYSHYGERWARCHLPSSSD